MFRPLDDVESHLGGPYVILPRKKGSGTSIFNQPAALIGQNKACSEMGKPPDQRVAPPQWDQEVRPGARGFPDA